MALQALDRGNFARYAAEFSGRMALGSFIKRIIRIKNQIHDWVTGPGKSPAVPFHMLQSAVRGLGLSMHCSLIALSK